MRSHASSILDAQRKPVTSLSLLCRPRSGNSRSISARRSSSGDIDTSALRHKANSPLEHAQRILADAQDLRRRIEELDKGLAGQLRLGVIPTALPVVSHLTAPYYALFPKVAVTVLSKTSQEIQRGVDDFELDVGITYLDNEPLDRVRVKPIYSEEYVFLTPQSGPYAGARSISWLRAAEAPLCLLTPDMQNRRIIDGVFRSVGVTPRPAVETNSIFNLVTHAASGRWSSIVPRQLLQFFGLPRGTQALELVDPTARRAIGLIMADRDPPSPLARNLLAMPFPDDILGRIAPPVRDGHR